MSEPNVERVRQINDAYNRGDFDAAAAHAHPDIVMVPPGNQLPYRGRDALRRWMEPDAFARQSNDIVEATAIADRVLVKAHARMTGAGSGIELELDVWSVWWFDEDGLVTRTEFFLDSREADEAAGVAA